MINYFKEEFNKLCQSENVSEEIEAIKKLRNQNDKIDNLVTLTKKLFIKLHYVFVMTS